MMVLIREIILALEAKRRNNPNKKVVDEKQLTMVNITDAKVTDDDNDSEFHSLGGGDSEASDYFDVPGRRLGDAEVSDRDVLKRQLNAADAKLRDNIKAAPETDSFLKIVAPINAMLLSILESLVGGGVFFALFLAVLISIYFVALPVLVFLTSAKIAVFLSKDMPIILWKWSIKTSARASSAKSVVYLAKDMPIILWNWSMKTSVQATNLFVARARNLFVERIYRSSKNRSYL